MRCGRRSKLIWDSQEYVEDDSIPPHPVKLAGLSIETTQKVQCRNLQGSNLQVLQARIANIHACDATRWCGIQRRIDEQQESNVNIYLWRTLWDRGVRHVPGREQSCNVLRLPRRTVIDVLAFFKRASA